MLPQVKALTTTLSSLTPRQDRRQKSMLAYGYYREFFLLSESSSVIMTKEIRSYLFDN